MMKTKKGVSHVEMMISFAIFISFVVFILVVFKPLKIFSESSLDVAEARIIDYVSTNLTVSSLILNSTFSATATPGECFYLNFSLPNTIIMKDENSDIISASKIGKAVYFGYSDRFYKIYSSEELEEKSLDISSCQNLEEENYMIGVTRAYRKISYSKLEDFFQKYNNYDNYQQLKQTLGLTNDFNIFVKSDSEVIFKGEKYKPRTIEIIAKDISIEILDENASLNPAIMNIQVWG